MHSSDRINVDSAVITLEGTCRFKPLKQKMGWLKRNCNDMGQLITALVKYADSDSTKDPESDEEKAWKGKKSGNAKGPQHNPANQGGNNKRKADGSLEFVATPVRKATINDVRGGHLLGLAGLVPRLSSC